MPVGDVLLVLFYSLPAIIAISFPFASLVGALMAVGRFSSDNEILSFQTSGVPLIRVFVPFFMIGIILSGISFVMNDYFLPLGNLELAKLMREMLVKLPELELESYKEKRYMNNSIITGEVNGSEINDIIIIDRSPKNERRIIIAKKAYLAENADSDEGILEMNMEEVFSLTTPAHKQQSFNYFTADTMTYNMILSQMASSISSAPSAREMSSKDLIKLIDQKQERLDEKLDQYDYRMRRNKYYLHETYREMIDKIQSGRWRKDNNLEIRFSNLNEERTRVIEDFSLKIDELELHKKFSIPLGCLTFVLLAFPIGLFAKRSGRSLGFGIGIFIAAIYWGLLVVGNNPSFIPKGLPVYLGMWMPNFFVLIIGAVIMGVKMRR